MTNAIALLLLTLPAQTPQSPATLWASPAKAEALAKVDVAQQKMLESLAEVAMQEAMAKLVQPSPEPPTPEPEPEPTVVPVAQPVTYYRAVPQYYFAPVIVPSYQPPCPNGICLPSR